MKEKITAREKEVIQFIKEFRREKKFNPSHDEIGEGLGITRSRIAQIFAELERKGWIVRDKKYKYRSFQLV